MVFLSSGSRSKISRMSKQYDQSMVSASPEKSLHVTDRAIKSYLVKSLKIAWRSSGVLRTACMSLKENLIRTSKRIQEVKEPTYPKNLQQDKYVRYARGISFSGRRESSKARKGQMGGARVPNAVVGNSGRLSEQLTSSPSQRATFSANTMNLGMNPSLKRHRIQHINRSPS